MNGQTRVDIARVGPGLVWAFEFDEIETVNRAGFAGGSNS